MNLHAKNSVIALSYFLIIAILGVLLRSFSIIVIDTNYRYLVHAHSHVALLGWVYTALMVLIYQMYLTNTLIYKKYIRVFWATQLTIVGMLITFPFTGYAFFSILFSTLFLITSYFFSYLVFTYTPQKHKTTFSYKCIRISLWYMILSSLGPWALGAIMSTLGETSSLYRNAIYFYLHFQYNGWFIVALFGILFYVLEQHKIKISTKSFQRFFWLFNIGVVLTFAISVLWMKPPLIIYSIAGIGALLQLIALGILIHALYPKKERIVKQFSSLFLISCKAIFIFYSTKLLLQFLGTFPSVASIISSNINFVIGYLHWVFLGVVSLALLAFLNHFKLIKLSKKIVILYIVVFLLTEFLIFYRGLVAWKNFYLLDSYPYLLVIASAFFLLVISLLLIFQFKKR